MSLSQNAFAKNLLAKFVLHILRKGKKVNCIEIIILNCNTFVMVYFEQT